MPKESLHRYQLWAAVLSLLTFALYFYSAPPHTTMEDASEFILTAHSLGLPHPPGYPLYTIIAHVFSFIPFLSPALKIALLSLLLLVASGFLLGRVVCRLSSNAYGGCLTFLLFALSTPVWSQAIVAEVYASHAFLMLLLFDLALGLRESTKSLRLWIFIFSLSLCHHWPLVIVTSPVFVPILWPRLRDFWRDKLILSVVFILGLSPYLYLFAAGAFSDFLFSGPVRDWDSFFKYVSRHEYRIRLEPLNSWKGNWAFARDLLFLVFRDFFGLSLLLGTLAVFLLFRRPGRTYLGLVLILMGCGNSFFLLVFWHPGYDVLAREIYLSIQILPMAGLAIASGLSLPLLDSIPSKNLRAGLLGFVAVLIAFSVYRRWPELDMHDDRFAENYAQTVLGALPKDSVLMTNGDADVGPLAYQHFLRGERPDIEMVSGVGALLPQKIFDRNSALRDRTHKQKIIQYVEARLREGRRVFAIKQSPYFAANGEDFPFQQYPYGWFVEIQRPGTEANPMDLDKLNQSTMDFFNSVKLSRNQYSYLRYELMSYGCEFLVRAEQDHPLIKVLPPCQYALAEWLFWAASDRRSADLFFQKALEGYKDWPDEEREEIAKRLLDTRLLLLNEMPGEARAAFLQETKDLLKESIAARPVCSNKLVPPLVPLSEPNEDWLQPFRSCVWFPKTAGPSQELSH